MLPLFRRGQCLAKIVTEERQPCRASAMPVAGVAKRIPKIRHPYPPMLYLS